MNKAQLINALANKCHLTRKDSDLAVNALFDIIIDQLEKGEKVHILHREDVLCCVEKTSEFTDIISGHL